MKNPVALIIIVSMLCLTVIELASIVFLHQA